MNVTRRMFVERALKGSVLALTFSVGGVSMLLTPQEARAQGVPLRNLTPEQVAILEALGEAILPGCTPLGLTQFIDHQLGADPDECLLLAKYFQIAPPYKNFYDAGLKIADGVARQRFNKGLPDLTPAEATDFVRGIAQIPGIVEGFPLGLFYMFVRSDAVDVMYGTPEGFAKLNVPYMEHILPPEGWNG